MLFPLWKLLIFKLFKKINKLVCQKNNCDQETGGLHKSLEKLIVNLILYSEIKSN